jgi:ribulose-bisphosphate carboxylase large chain
VAEPSILLTYLLRTGADAAPRAEALLLEQTVELSRAAVDARRPETACIGEVVSITRTGDDTHRVILRQPAHTAADDPAQLLNVLFGNSSLQEDVVLADVSVPAGSAAALGGPRFGIPGLRQRTGVHGRAWTCTALKPMGLSAAQVGRLCGLLAQGGLDIIKDDHGLANHPFCRFEDRVRACTAAIDAAAQATGRRAVYAPNLIGSPSAVFDQARRAQDLGAGAILVSPMLVGMPVFHELVRRHLDVPVLAHPAFAGALRMTPPALLGQLFPLFGADTVIFPNFGGRFSYSENTCRELADALRSPQHGHPPSAPVPAGGISLDRVAALRRFYGADTVFLLGGSLLEAHGDDALLDRCRRFTAAVGSATP